MNKRQIHSFYNFSKAIRQFVWLFTCFVRVVNLKLFLKQTLPIPKRPHNLKKSSNLIWHYILSKLKKMESFYKFLWSSQNSEMNFSTQSNLQKFCWASSKIQRKLYSNYACTNLLNGKVCFKLVQGQFAHRLGSLYENGLFKHFKNNITNETNF